MFATTALRTPLRHYGLSLGHLTEQAAGLWIRSLGLPDSAQACVHREDLPFPHFTISVALPAGTGLPLITVGAAFAEAAGRACAAHASGRSGRAVHFRGCALAPGLLTVGDLQERTDIVRVTAGDLPAQPDDLLDTTRRPTPHWIDGELTLRTDRRPDGVLVPAPRFGW
ncbi:hypothetical protein GCM10010112_22880 [Actinoplanes lobatus]|uniref:Uncharacterized protein n=1 Tax=Actinoplanes lobatus TaxID=113568 RepID=A0A7W7HIV6_9ACTN|nr:hypothetical protein [Actinoplanes lobatus]MBB4751331.1 hypothetical protein [Actinoplanes lobatus]GGN63546.1 hypothetical protein GCM10010112_22880 [Actinoplanes lobatus]GIE40940.1 hypothetical protein Alo02nite_38380 [Actinoplanes lobatus]